MRCFVIVKRTEAKMSGEVPGKVRRNMTIGCSTDKIIHALVEIEQHLNQAREELEKVRIIAKEARNSPDIPQNVDISFLKIIGEIDRTIGGTRWEPTGKLKNETDFIRTQIPRRSKESIG